MSLWWLEPGWKATTCAACGVNIWNSGGDPDWGYCYECFSRRTAPEPEPSHRCDICGEHEAVTGVNGYGVCSESCAHAAETRAPADEEPSE